MILEFWYYYKNEKHFNIIDNCSFTRNRFFGIWLVNVRQLAIFRDCRFDNNNGTPILAHGSTFQLSGENVFSNNTAIRGGGLALYQSQVSFYSRSTTRFENSTAREYGGGIYIATDSTFPQQLGVALESIDFDELISSTCFYYSEHTNSDTLNVTFFGLILVEGTSLD